ncbi:hypothetical protein [Pseudomonas putida]|uniref:hypothetical protein n=1 Tax=Pseudomonas putida TaxID=303 RepID=UPI001CD28FB5|nr:hypothetical protein [Pseudomonas putida]
MTLTPYRYAGPASAVSLYMGETRQKLDVLLHPGKTVELPADHVYTRALLALNHLHPLPTHAKSTAKTRVLQQPAKD